MGNAHPECTPPQGFHPTRPPLHYTEVLTPTEAVDVGKARKIEWKTNSTPNDIKGCNELIRLFNEALIGSTEKKRIWMFYDPRDFPTYSQDCFLSKVSDKYNCSLISECGSIEVNCTPK